jgi:hypothetical protein
LERGVRGKESRFLVALGVARALLGMTTKNKAAIKAVQMSANPKRF